MSSSGSIPLWLACVFLFFKISQQCALPYWWIEAYSLPPNLMLRGGAPKTTYRYRESLQVFDPNNFVHVKEYAEYSWWEHNEPGGGDVPSVLTTKTTRVTPKTSGMTPKTSGVTPKTSRVTPSGITNFVSTTKNPDVERNENEALDQPQLDDLQETGNDLLQAEENTHRGPSFLSPWFRETANETRPCKASEADIQSLRSMIEKMFSFPRDQYFHPEQKEQARHDILNKFRNFGLQVWTQNFTTPVLNDSAIEEVREGVNLVGVIPGTQRGQMQDGIVLVGAHYDTVADSNGVDDNGSGLAVMLEVAKALSEAHCKFNNTLMFVAFDLEEDGAMGSSYFVENYLIPEELKRARAHFQGAFILDGVMNFNDAPNTQQLPLDFAQSLPGLQSFVNYTGNRGDFLAMISRNSLDNHLTHQLMESWQKLGDPNYKLYNLAVDMGNDMPPPMTLENHLNFLNSDHATFWYHNSSSKFPETLNAVLLTDTGPFRGQMQECYHNKCDDLTNMSPEKLQFAKKTADALTATLVELTRATAGGETVKGHSALLLLVLVATALSTKMMVSES